MNPTSGPNIKATSPPSPAWVGDFGCKELEFVEDWVVEWRIGGCVVRRVTGCLG